jgi:hypothetical protein
LEEDNFERKSAKAKKTMLDYAWQEFFKKSSKNKMLPCFH